VQFRLTESRTPVTVACGLLGERAKGGGVERSFRPVKADSRNDALGALTPHGQRTMPVATWTCAIVPSKNRRSLSARS
jgi:hypothetical protein